MCLVRVTLCAVHATSLLVRSALKILVEGQTVSYETQEGRNGRVVACNLSVLKAAEETTQAAE